MKHKLFILFLFSFLLISIFQIEFIETVKAVDYGKYNFQDATHGDTYYNSPDGALNFSASTLGQQNPDYCSIHLDVTGNKFIKSVNDISELWLNFTYPINESINKMSFQIWWGTGNYVWDYIYYNFQNSDNDTVIWMRIFEDKYGKLAWYQYCNHLGSWTTIGGGYGSCYYWQYMNFTYLDYENVNYSFYYNGTSSYDVYKVGTPYKLTGNTRITHCRVKEMRSGTSGFNVYTYIDNVSFSDESVSQGDEGSGYYFYLKFYDVETLQQLQYKKCPLSASDSQFQGRLKSDMWGDDDYPFLNSWPNFNPMPIFNMFLENEGDYHYLNVTGCIGEQYIQGRDKDGNLRLYAPYSERRQIYTGQTYYIYLTPKDYEGGLEFPNCETIEHYSPDCNVYMCLDNYAYDYGQTIILKYKFPHLSKLKKHGQPTSGYYLTLWRDDQTDDFGFFPNNDDALYVWSQASGDILLNGEWNFLSWTVNSTYGYSTRWDEYKMLFYHPSDWWDSMDSWGARHQCTGDLFTPEGEIISITPSTPHINQEVKIAYTSNSSGWLYIVHDLSGQEWSFYYQYTGGTLFSYFTPRLPDKYYVYLYSNFQNTLLDDTSFTCSGDPTEYGFTGFNAEYLECFDYRYIAGDKTRNVTIKYRTLKSGETLLRITTPRGENSSYSCMVNQTGRLLSFWLPPEAPIGLWNVTLFGNDTHYSSFSVINEEGNYIEFGRHTYYDNEQFTLLLKHDYYVGLTFKKDGIAQGQTWKIPIGKYAFETNLIVPLDIVTPEVGSWTVEMWRLNFENRQYILSEYPCVVKQAPISTTVQGMEGLAVFIANIDPILKGLVGLGITLGCLFMPFGVVKGLGKAGFKSIDIPPIIYAVCCGAGAVTSMMFGLWGIEYAFFICVMAGIGLFAVYITKIIPSKGA